MPSGESFGALYQFDLKAELGSPKLDDSSNEEEEKACLLLSSALFS